MREVHRGAYLRGTPWCIPERYTRVVYPVWYTRVVYPVWYTLWYNTVRYTLWYNTVRYTLVGIASLYILVGIASPVHPGGYTPPCTPWYTTLSRVHPGILHSCLPLGTLQHCGTGRRRRGPGLWEGESNGYSRLFLLFWQEVSGSVCLSALDHSVHIGIKHERLDRTRVTLSNPLLNRLKRTRCSSDLFRL